MAFGLLDVEQALQTATEAALKAGELLLGKFGRLQEHQIDAKTEFDFVTEADRSAEQLIVDMLSRKYPDHGFLGEEFGRSDHQSEFNWIIDPLDGTKNFIHSFPLFSISIALRRQAEILCGVVYLPALKELFTAQLRKGAFLNGKPIRVSSQSALNRCMVATGFPHAAKEYLDTYLACFKAIFLQVSAIRRAGSAAIDLAYTACGRFDGFWEFKLNPWDMAAGVLLITEAGGIVSDPVGGKHYLSTGDILAAPPSIHRQLLQLLQPICSSRLGWSVFK